MNIDRPDKQKNDFTKNKLQRCKTGKDLIDMINCNQDEQFVTDHLSFSNIEKNQNLNYFDQNGNEQNRLKLPGSNQNYFKDQDPIEVQVPKTHIYIDSDSSLLNAPAKSPNVFDNFFIPVPRKQAYQNNVSQVRIIDSNIKDLRKNQKSLNNFTKKEFKIIPKIKIQRPNKYHSKSLEKNNQNLSSNKKEKLSNNSISSSIEENKRNRKGSTIIPTRVLNRLKKQYLGNFEQINLYESKYYRITQSCSKRSSFYKMIQNNQNYSSFPNLVDYANKHQKNIDFQINKLEYYKRINFDKCFRKDEKLSIYELFIMSFFHEKYDDISNNEQVLNLLGSYFYRPMSLVKSSIESSLEELKSKIKIVDFNKLVSEVLVGMSQELQIKKSIHPFDLASASSSGIIRFSFYIDLFVLILCDRCNLSQFPNDYSVLVNVKKFLKKDSGIKKVKNVLMQYEKQQKFRSIENIDDLDGLVKFGIDKCLNKIEELIFEKKKLHPFCIVKKVEYDPQKRMYQDLTKKTNYNTKNVGTKMITFEEDLLQNTKNMQNNFLPQSTNKENPKCLEKYPIKQKASTSITQTEIKTTSKKEKCLLGKRPEFSTDSIEIKSGDNHTHLDKEEQINYQGLLNNNTSDIIFFNFGISFLKQYFRFDSIRIEELSKRDILFLKKFVSKLIKNQGTNYLGEILFQIITFRPCTIKEYLRNLELFHDILNKVGDQNLQKKNFLQMIHLIIKVRDILKFLNSRFFPEQEILEKSESVKFEEP